MQKIFSLENVAATGPKPLQHHHPAPHAQLKVIQEVKTQMTFVTN